ncbi:hypothetical protein HPG69_002881 [Diceros bicornis minor]|uniref:Uncharacterized protein n=1 Tax=Diceros bicornis minor TaxID=77932 RepID=A0A7J7ER44_DICBM|nr:hypothetical protein HPG69_002881 [Diceros bicornis minor]
MESRAENELKGGHTWSVHDALSTIKAGMAPAVGEQVALLLDAADAPPPFPAHKSSRLTESPLGWNGRSGPTSLQTVAQTAERKTQRRESWNESGHGPDPKLFRGNMDSPGYQPGAPLSVSNCPCSCPLKLGLGGLSRLPSPLLMLKTKRVNKGEVP